jgi:hypothetical protein
LSAIFLPNKLSLEISSLNLWLLICKIVIKLEVLASIEKTGLADTRDFQILFHVKHMGK